MVHRNGVSSRLIFALLFSDVVMGAPSAHHAVCGASCSSLTFCVGLFLGLVLTRQSGGAHSSSPSILSSSSSDIRLLLI